MRVDKIGSKTGRAEIRLPRTAGFAVCLKTFLRLLVVVLGLLVVSGIYGPEVHASETKLVDLPANYQSIWREHAAARPFSAHPVAFKPAESEYRFTSELVSGTNLYSEFGRLRARSATPTLTPQDKKVSDKSYMVFLLVGGLVVLMAIFIVVVVKVLKKLKDLSNGR